MLVDELAAAGEAGPIVRRTRPQITRRHLEVVLGALWLLDGALQLQPHNFTPGFFASILGMANMGLPGPASTADYHLARVLADHPGAWNALFASLQLVLGAGLLWSRTARWARAGSVPWALGVWVVGEGFGGVFMGGTSLLTGAPGAALLYAVIAVLLCPMRPGRAQARVALGAWAAVWFGSALLEFGATNHTATVPAAQIRNTAAGQWRLMRIANDAVARLVAGDGAAFAVVLGLVGAAIGLGVLYPRARRAALIAGAAVGALAGVVGQDLGLIFSGQATDPGSGPLLVLMALAVTVATAPLADRGRRMGGARRPSRHLVPGITRLIDVGPATGRSRRSPLRHGPWKPGRPPLGIGYTLSHVPTKRLSNQLIRTRRVVTNTALNTRPSWSRTAMR